MWMAIERQQSEHQRIERQQVEQLAHLARIALDESTLARTTKSLGDVLALIDQLQAVDTTGIAPMAHPLDAVQRLRADVVTEPDQREVLQAIAPAVQDGLFLVPKVIE
jgi:aspartyl-tRNA(Asn)/glutamyl-tRNA(Gln) amidotransferase subunit C